MDFLTHAALPQSTEHFRLLLFVLNVAFVVFLPYLGFLLGSVWAAFRHDVRGRTTGNPLYVRFARDLTHTAVFSKSGLAFLVVIPSLSLVFLYAQLLQGTPAIATALMGTGFLALLTGVILLGFYRYTFDLDTILGAALGGHPREKNDLTAAIQGNERIHLKVGRYGAVLLSLGTVLTVGAATVASDPVLWSSMNSVFDLLLSVQFWLRLVLFGALSLGATGVGILFFLLSWQGGVTGADAEYGDLIRKFGVRLSVVALLALPLLIVASVFVMPANTLSGLLYFLVGLGLVFLFLTAQFLYAFRRDGAPRYTAYAFFALAISLTILFTKDQLAIGNATKMQAARLALSYEEDLATLRTRLGIALVSMSGQEIYDAKCSACHLFDQKKVGPPYKMVIPKYAGRRAQLISFVLNPIKVDPAYPNMPNQGLRPAEADSIVTFLLSKFVPAASTPAAAAPGTEKK
jgi:cytochrome c